MNSDQILIYKAVLSNKAALAGALASASVYSHLFHKENPNKSVEKDYLSDLLGDSMFTEFKNLGNKEYRDTAIEEIKVNKDMAKIFNSLKQLPPKPFMGNIQKNIEDGYIDVISKNIMTGDYIFVISPAYHSAIYYYKDIDFPSDDLKRIAINDLHCQFEKDSQKLMNFYSDISEKGHQNYFLSFGTDLINQIFSQAQEVESPKSIIMAMLEHRIGQFIENE